MPRCNNCQKFVSIDADSEPDIEVEYDVESKRITGEVTIDNNCADCGNTLKRGLFDVSIDCSDEVRDHICEEGDSWSVDGSLERDSDQRPPHRKVRTTFYIVRGSFDVECACGELKFSKDFEAEIKASHMEDM